MSTSRCGEIFITPHKGFAKKEGGTFFLAVVLLLAAGAMSWRRCESETTLFGLPKRIQLESVVKLYLQHCSRAVQHKYSSLCGTIHGGLFPEPGRRVALLAGLHKGCSIKWGNFSFARTVWRFWLTACKYVSAYDDSNASFEQCRVVLLVWPFSDHKCRHGKVYAARCNTMPEKTV